MRLERVIKNLRDFQLWWFFTLGPRGVYFIIILCFSVGPDQLFPADSYTATSATGAVKLNESSLMNEAWRRFHRCRCRLCCCAPWPDIWIILPFASNVMERYTLVQSNEFSLISQLFVI